MIVFASPNDHGHLLLTENTPVVLDTSRIDLVHEELTIQLTTSKVEQLLTILVSRLVVMASCFSCHQHVVVSWLAGQHSACSAYALHNKIFADYMHMKCYVVAQ